MAIMFRPCVQISSCRASKSQVLNAVWISVNSRGTGKKFFWSRSSKKPDDCPDPPTRACKSDKNVFRKSTCRKRLPQCPDFIDKGEPSRCCDKDYGKPIKVKKTWWTNVKASPPMIKQKPSNCAPPPCPKPETFMEYIFGPEEPLPEPRTCRRAWKIKQSCNPEDPRLEDPRYQETPGDVLLYTEPDKRRTQLPKEPQPVEASPYKTPAGVICKRIRDSVAETALECYCVCLDPCMLRQKCADEGKNLCPVHTKPFRFPYDEMKPENRRKKFFTNKSGVEAEDVMQPPRSESCTCVHSAFVDKANASMPEHETCDLHEALQKRGALLKLNDIVDSDNRHLSKCQRLAKIVREKEKQMSKVNVPVPRRNPLPCESKCKDICVYRG